MNDVPNIVTEKGQHCKDRHDDNVVAVRHQSSHLWSTADLGLSLNLKAMLFLILMSYVLRICYLYNVFILDIVRDEWMSISIFYKTTSLRPNWYMLIYVTTATTTPNWASLSRSKLQVPATSTLGGQCIFIVVNSKLMMRKDNSPILLHPSLGEHRVHPLLFHIRRWYLPRCLLCIYVTSRLHIIPNCWSLSKKY